MSIVLITGGSGLVGSRLTKLLAEKHEVRHLSTRKNYQPDNAKAYYWDVKKGEIEPEAMANVNHIVHLAGASVAGERWTDERKKTIYNSRIDSTNLLLNKVKEYQVPLTSFVCASAIGYYPANTGEILMENHPAGNDFLANVCMDWEKAALQFETIQVDTAILRTGIVLANEGGAYKEMVQTMPAFVSKLGSGNQVYSWLHVHDLARMYQHVMENKVKGIFNAVGPAPAAQKDIAKEIVRDKLSPVLPTPNFALRLVLGEMADVVLNSQHCSSKKIENTGFTFQFPDLPATIADLRN